MVAKPNCISVIIPTYRRRASVQRVLAALAEQTLPPDRFEALVAIDGSEDGTRELVAQFAAPYQLRGLWQLNRGRAAACNMGLAAASGELIVILDDDMEPAPGFLAAHLAAHARGDRLAVLGAVPVALDQARPVTGLIAAKFSTLQARLAQPGRTIHFREFYSGNASIRAAELAAVGGFDEAFKVYGNEDSELALRLLRAGVQITFCAEALARQHYAKDFAALARDNVAKGRTAVLLASKAPETFGDLRLSTYHQGARKWRGLRAALLLLSRVWPAAPTLVIWVVEQFERRRPRRLLLYYDLALDYFFWLGALPALRANRSAGSGLTRLPKAAEGAWRWRRG
jgi:GT2 family glycosyltransferase